MAETILPQDDACYACSRPLRTWPPATALTSDDSRVYVGPECHAYIVAGGDEGWQPPKGGPRLFTDVCDGCQVRHPWEHRCSGNGCSCKDCREAAEAAQSEAQP